MGIVTDLLDQEWSCAAEGERLERTSTSCLIKGLSSARTPQRTGLAFVPMANATGRVLEGDPD